MNAKDYAQIMDAMAQIIEMVSGYRAQLEESGYSPTAAEAMSIDFHRMLVTQAGKTRGTS